MRFLSTAVQALARLNDPTFLEAAKALGQRLLREPEKGRLSLAYRLTLGREPGKDESAILNELIAKSRQRKRRGPAWHACC